MNTLLEGKYEILAKLREGGMGTIYKVRHRLLDEIRVVKIMQPHAAADSELRDRFLREARLAIRVRHPNIVQLFDFSIDDAGTAVIVMEFIDGVSLQDLLRGGPLPSVPFAVEIGFQALTALACLHANGIIHRDISSDNVMLASGVEGRPVVKLIDLGIAKDRRASVAGTSTGIFMGKAAYAAPELFEREGASGLSSAADVYSFGVVFYELVTGRLPIEGGSFAELAGGHLFRPPLPFAQTDPHGRVPEPLREVVLAALEKDPARRLASAEEFARRIAALRARDDAAREEVAALLRRARGTAAVEAGPISVGKQEILDERFAASSTSAPGAPAFAEAERAAQIRALVDATLTPALGPDGWEIFASLEAYETALAQPPAGEPSATDPDPNDEADAEAVFTPEETIAAPRRAARLAVIAKKSAGGEAAVGRTNKPAPPVAEEPRPARRGAWLVIAAVVVVVVLLAAGVGVLWFTLTKDRGATTQRAVSDVDRVLSMGDGTQKQVEEKLQSIATLLAVPGHENDRGRLQAERVRLTSLTELHRHASRLDDLVRSLSDPERRADVSAQAGGTWDDLRRYRQQFLPSDPRALEIENRARDVLRRIANSLGDGALLKKADLR